MFKFLFFLYIFYIIITSSLPLRGLRYATLQGPYSLHLRGPILPYSLRSGGPYPTLLATLGVGPTDTDTQTLPFI